MVAFLWGCHQNCPRGLLAAFLWGTTKPRQKAPRRDLSANFRPRRSSQILTVSGVDHFRRDSEVLTVSGANHKNFLGVGKDPESSRENPGADSPNLFLITARPRHIASLAPEATLLRRQAFV